MAKKVKIPPNIKTNVCVFLTCLLSLHVGHLTCVGSVLLLYISSSIICYNNNYTLKQFISE